MKSIHLLLAQQLYEAKFLNTNFPKRGETRYNFVQNIYDTWSERNDAKMFLVKFYLNLLFDVCRTFAITHISCT